jgi:toxin FitB
MKQPVVLDTDISSLAIKGQLPLVWHAKLVWTKPVMTFITRGELVQWTLTRNLGKQRKGQVHNWIAKSHFLPGNEAVDIFGELSAAAIRRGRPRPVSDTWIAACCRVIAFWGCRW